MLDASTALDLCRSALISAMVIAAPVLIVGIVVGLVMGFFQALTQIQDQTVAFVPKLLATATVLVLCMPWVMSRMIEFTREVFQNAGVP